MKIMTNRFLIITAFIFASLLVAAIDTEAGGGGGKVYKPTVFGFIYDTSGTVEIKPQNAESYVLGNDKHLLKIINNGDKLRTGEDGRAVIMTSIDNSVYVLEPNTLAVIANGFIKATRGVINKSAGLHLPENTSQNAGIIKVKAQDEQSCLSITSPYYGASIISDTPILQWSNNCEGSKKVSVKIISGNSVIYQAVTSDDSLKPPKGTLKSGEAYSWLVDSGANGIAGGSFSIMTDEKIREALEAKARFSKNKDMVSERLSYIFYLLDNNMTEAALSEVKELKTLYPDNPNIIVLEPVKIVDPVIKTDDPTAIPQ